MTRPDDEQEWEPELQDEVYDEVHDEVFDEDDDPGGDQLPCPSCGAPVYDDTDRCPHCGDWIMPLASAARSKSWVWIVAAVLVVIAMLCWIFG